jgi:hypothetical protein
MAGEVRCDVFGVPGANVLDVVARECPVTQRYGEVCIRVDLHSGETLLCPFWYGLATTDGAHHCGEARSLQEVLAWLASQEGLADRSYTVRCLRKESAGVEPGATRRR